MPRAASRYSGRYMLDWIAAVRAPFAGGFDMALAFMAVLHGNIRDFSADAELNGLPPDQGLPRVPISARSIARSIMLPHETTRRHVEALIADGWIERRDGGVVAAPGAVAGPRLRPTVERLYERLAAMLDSLAALDPPSRPFRLAEGREPLAMALAGGLMLRWVERYVGEVGRLNPGVLIFWAVMHANVEHFSQDMEFQHRYRDQPPPDELRRPVSVRRISEILGLPYETVRHRVGLMFGLGLLTRVEGGVIAPRQVLQDNPASHRADIADLRRLLTHLTECGVLLPG